MVRDAASGIQARQMRNYEIDTIKLVMISLLACIMIFPMLSGHTSFEVRTVDKPTNQNVIAADDILLTIPLTAQSNYIATGNVTTYRGFAYSDDDADFLRFVDPINQVTLNQSIESGTLKERSITGVDIDYDGSTEFLILNNNGTADNLLVVDFNDGLTTSYNVTIDTPEGITTGDFNGDSFLDVGIIGRFGVITLDLQTDQLIGNFTFTGFGLDGIAIGRFLEPTEDSIALAIYTATKDGNLSIIAGNGTIMRSMMMHTEINGISKFEYGAGLDDLAITMYDDVLVTITPDTMAVIFNITGLPDRSQVLTGYLNHDTQEDLFVIQHLNNHSVFVDGTNGSIIRQSVEVYGTSKGNIGLDPATPLCADGNIDADNLTDFALLTAVDGNAGFLRGVDGEIGYNEPTISSKPAQLRVYDVNNNSKDDIFVLEGQTVYVLLSDVQAPIIIPEPLEPPHPTLHDPYIEIEVGIEDNTSIIVADIFLRHEDGNWSQPIDEMQNAGNQYFAFLVGLPEGFYHYYLVFQDTYLNIETLGNQTQPLNFTVAGHLAWSDSKNQDSAFEHHLMDIGNTSDGGEVIYILDSTAQEIWLERYTPRGENQSLGLVSNRTYSDFWIYTGMMDGDNILDPIVLLYNATARSINVTLYHGSSGSPWFSSVYPGANFTNPHSPTVYDCDNDGVDEFFFVSEKWVNFSYAPGYFVQFRTDGSWSEVMTSGSRAEFYGVGIAKTVSTSSTEAAVSASSGGVDIFNATSMSLISSHNVTSEDHLVTVPVSTYAFNNGSEPLSQFMLYSYFLDVAGFSCGFRMFDATTPRINETTSLEVSGNLYLRPMLIDVNGDGTDDIVAVDYFASDLTLIKLGNPIVVEWSVPTSNSQFLSSVIVDFDGDGEDEVGVFTKEDETLRIISLDGVLERSLVVGMGYGSMQLSNVDLGYGEEIVAYPLVQNGVTKIGVIRDINLIRRLNASLTYTPTDLFQGADLSVYVDVTNIYSEVISDAEVYLTIHYYSGTTLVNSTKALIFDTSNYTISIGVNWPIGIVNLSLQVNHFLYNAWEQYYPNALTVRSPLDVSVYTNDIVMQNSTFSVDITVTDSLGSRVSDAIVIVTLDGTDYPATYDTTQYRLGIPNINLVPGEYEINATVTHPFDNGTTWTTSQFSLVTDDPQVESSIPILLEQDADMTGWLNITDIFGNSIENAQVEILSTGYEFELTELAPGCYYLNSTAEIAVGNHTFTIYIVQDYVQGTSFGNLHIAVTGNLSLSVPELLPVRGGEDFDVVVYLSDLYGTTPSDAWVTIELDGTNVTAMHLGGGRYTAVLNATYAAGEWTYTVYYGSDYSHSKYQVFDLLVFSDPVYLVNPSENWSVDQSHSTTIEVQVTDWLDTYFEDASVTLLIRGTTYALEHESNGLYSVEISTIGWPYGVHTYYLTVDHQYLYQSQSTGNLTVVADPQINIIPNTATPVQFGLLNLTIEVTDLYENPISDLNVQVSFADTTKVAQESAIRGTYTVAFDIGAIPHDDYNITVTIEGDLSNSDSDYIEIFVDVYIPSMEALGTVEISFAAGISLFLSLIGMILFVKVSSVISTSPRDTDDIISSIKQLDRIYVILVALSGLVFLHSWNLYGLGAYEYALLESLILLGSSVLLYGLWLYRDAYSSILVLGKISKRRAALGMWHLVLVPFMVLLIFYYGTSIEVFQRFILEVPNLVIGELIIPPMLATVLATYLSSIVVVVISFYREIGKGISRIDGMLKAGTPKDVVDEEQALLIGRTGSSIRIKFLMFLMILGATTIMQLDFLRNYSMAAIILIPVVFLVLIPFISSRIVKGAPKMMDRLRRGDSAELASIDALLEEASKYESRAETEDESELT